MNARQRFLDTVQGNHVDRIPVTLFIVEQGHFITQLHPETDCYDHETQIKQIVEFQQEIGADVMVRLLADLYEPALHVVYGGINTTSAENWDVCTKTLKNGNTTIYQSTIRTPLGELKQEFSVNELRKGTLMYACTQHPIKTPKDLEMVKRFEPAMRADYPSLVQKAFQTARRIAGEEAIVSAWVPYGPFNTASLLVDLSDIYILYLTEPEFYHDLMTFCIERNKPYCQAILNANPDVVHVGGNVPGGFLGKNTYDTYISRYEKQYILFCQKSGVPAMYHNCGEIMALIESYKDIGVKIVEPFSPPPLGDTRLSEALQTIHGDYAVVAGIDQVNVLQNGTCQDVIRATQQLIETGKPFPKFMAQNADFLEYGTPVDNIHAFVSTAKELGGF